MDLTRAVGNEENIHRDAETAVLGWLGLLVEKFQHLGKLSMFFSMELKDQVIAYS